MKKNLLIALSFLIFLGLIGALLFRFVVLSQRNSYSPTIAHLEKSFPVLKIIGGSSPQNGQVLGTVNSVSFRIISKIPEYTIVSDQFDLAQLQVSLHNLGLDSLRNKDFIEYTVGQNGVMSTRIRKADFKTIQVTFLPASQLPPNYADTKLFPYVHFADETISGRILNSFFAGVSHGDTFEIAVYIDPIAAKQFQLSNSQYLSSSFLESLYFNFNDQYIKSFSNPTVTYQEAVKDISHPVFQVTEATSDLSIFSLKKWRDLLIPQAYAQLCGSVTCGRSAGSAGTCSGIQVAVYNCSVSGFSCTQSPNSCLPYGGSCLMSYQTQNPGASCNGPAVCAAINAGTCVGYTPFSCIVTGTSTCSMQYFDSFIACKNDCGDCNVGACGVASCTWGAWSACSLTCGGGTQTRTSSCGATQTQSCNSQSCCGNGVCGGGETCGSCSTDCGACAPPPGPSCGDNVCNNGETCSTCAHDCGACAPSCTPSCATACGQANGCGGSCSNADVGTPATPTGLNPPDGTAEVTNNGSVTLSWDLKPLATLYQVEVYPTGTTPGQECTAPYTHCPANSSVNNYTFAADAGVTSYSWIVRAINTNCGSTLNSAWTAPSSFSFGGSFSGSYYLDDAGSASLNPGTGLCQSASAPLTSPPGGTTTQAFWGGNTTAGTIVSSAYSINNIGYAPNTVVSTTLPLGYRCSCPAGCSYSGLSVPLGNVNFYITTNPLGWWQSSNGYVYAAATTGTAIQSEIPATCTGACIAAISKYDSANTLTSDSTSLSGGGAIDSTADTTTTYSYLNQSGNDSHAQGMTLNGPREDYTYFSQLYGITTGNVVDFTGNQPASAPTNGSAYYANTDTTINNPWTVDTATSIVVFVNGNLTITKPILIAKGGFVAFIVKGNITFDKTLGSNSATTPSAEGVFIANGQIITQSAQPADDLKFIGDGTFVGWTGISLQRNFNNANVARGNTEPIETFNYRPDFLLSVPTKMTKPLFLWQEVN